MEDRQVGMQKSESMDPFLERLAKELVQERIDHGHIDLRSMCFADMEMMSHQIAVRLARQLGHELTSRQSELYSDDYCCPTCGLECEAIERARTVQTIDGPTEVVEVKSYCPKCRRSFFPCASRDGVGPASV